MLCADLSSPAQTRELGRVLAAALGPPALVTLRGELGTGKTTLVRETLRALGVRDVVASPSFTLAQSYQTPEGVRVHHLDLYRLSEGPDVELFAWDDYLGGAMTFVEWPEAGAAQLPPATLDVELSHVAPERRRARLRAAGDLEHALLTLLGDVGVSVVVDDGEPAGGAGAATRGPAAAPPAQPSRTRPS
jgi:tRNA threonylcarbamoyladenosine biosynthesis protein TsaE